VNQRELGMLGQPFKKCGPLLPFIFAYHFLCRRLYASSMMP